MRLCGEHVSVNPDDRHAEITPHKNIFSVKKKKYFFFFYSGQFTPELSRVKFLEHQSTLCGHESS